MIHSFISKFSDMKITAVKIGNDYYKCSQEIAAVKNHIDVKPCAVGIFLGSKARNEFKPSIALLETIAEKSDRKIVVDKKGEWLFLCGRDLFGNSIIDSNFFEKGDIVLVQNERDENLGYGEIVANISDEKNQQKMVVKNLLDRGSFLRRERNPW